MEVEGRERVIDQSTLYVCLEVLQRNLFVQLIYDNKNVKNFQKQKIFKLNNKSLLHNNLVSVWLYC
jgi:hypothetical protein